MIDPATMIAISGGLQAAGGIASSLMGSGSANKGAEEMAAAMREATALQKEMFYKGREDLAPWRTTGGDSVNALWKMIQAGPGEFTADPGYQFRLDEGTKAIERSAAARGNVLSGAALKSLSRYGQDYASNEYTNFLNRYYQSLSPYQQLAGMGLGAAGTTAASGNQMASSVANTLMSGQNAINNMNIQGANAITGGINAVTGAANQGLNNYLLWQMTKGQGQTPVKYPYETF